MKTDKIRFLVFAMNDPKFLLPVLKSFDLDDRIEYKSLLFLHNKKSQCKISDVEDLEIIRDKKVLKSRLAKDDYDVVYFFSMVDVWWKILDYIPKNKKIIWWAWGYDLYDVQARGLKPLIKLPLYKTNTLKLLHHTLWGLKESVRTKLLEYTLGLYYGALRKHRMYRIDYIQPVFSLEYDYIKELNLSNFKALPFYILQQIQKTDFMLSQRNPNGSIILGHSAQITGNHLDVFTDIKKYIPIGREIVVPLNYGMMDYADIVKKVLVIQGELMNIRVLDKFLPLEAYHELLKNCSYAIYGAIRQQAMGNISWAIRQGIKVFLYKDSLIYKHLKNCGIIVYAIEDIDENSFNTPLTKEELEINMNAKLKELENRAGVYENVMNQLLNEL